MSVEAKRDSTRLSDEEVRELVKKFAANGGRKANKDNSKAKSKHVDEVREAKKEERGEVKKRVVGIRLVETRFGKRILIEQGSQRVWLREADVVQLMTLITRELFGEEEKQE